ncbi:MAG: alginate lyase family protein [Planctomycetota bacterium]
MKIAKIRGRSLEEIAFRLKQFTWNRMDRFRHIRELRLLDPCRLLEGKDPSSKFFLNFGDSEEIVKKFNKVFPDSSKNIIKEAERILEHRFNLLGHRDLTCGGKEGINWHLDPVNNKVSPIIWWEKINFFDTRLVGDHKVVWELNRHQFLLFLSLASLLSDEEKYSEKFFSLLDSWFRSNPPKKGINWTSSMELALRSIAWIWAYHLLNIRKRFPNEFLSLFITYLFIQAEHIEHNLSTYFSPNTHITGEALGLFYIGLFLSGFKDSKRWVEIGREILFKELRRQVLPDGGYMERSIWYHRWTLEFYLHFYLLARRNDIYLPKDVELGIERLAEFLMYSLRPDRTFPLIGDDDGGRLFPLDSLKGNDPRGLFSTLAVIFKRGDFKYLSEGYKEETFWLLGSESKGVYDMIEEYEPHLTSKGFKETGYFFMRSNWSERANYMAFDCGPHGWLNCGHSHADLLSLQITSGKRPIVVDPGTYAYTGEYRDYFRGADSHSIIKVDGFYPAITSRPFHWKLVPQHGFINWISNNKYDYASGCMKGNVNWKHIREVFFIKPDIFFIVDSLEGGGKHEVEIRFPLYGKEWVIEDRKCLLKNTHSTCSIECAGQANLNPQLIDSWVSLCYGHKMSSYTLLFKGVLSFPCKTGFLINLSGHNCKAQLLAVVSDTSFKILSKETGSEIFVYNACE